MLITIFIVKLLKGEGHKSQAFRILCLMIVALTLVGLLANFIQTSTDSTNKFSFKGAGTVYRRRYILKKEVESPKNEFEDTSEVKKMTKQAEEKLHNLLDQILLGLASKNETMPNSKETETQNSQSLSKTSFYKSSKSKSIDTKRSQDFCVLSSFECNGSIPTAFTSYISSTFVTEYERSYGDFATTLQGLPKLTDVQVNCVLGQPCHTLFENDKQRGINSTSDMKYLRENVFYCCPPMDSFTNETVAQCNYSRTIIEKSTFRESKKPFLLGRVNLFLKC